MTGRKCKKGYVWRQGDKDTENHRRPYVVHLGRANLGVNTKQVRHIGLSEFTSVKDQTRKCSGNRLWGEAQTIQFGGHEIKFEKAE